MKQNEHINRAIEYILRHINENITVDDIASHCNFSRYYFSRIFKMTMGESIYEFTKRVKMEQSAFRIKVERSRSITDICSDYGYSSSNFSVAFKDKHNLSPIEFRKRSLKDSLTHPILNSPIVLETFKECNQKITIEFFEDMNVIYERYKGSYTDLSTKWDLFTQKYSDLITKQTLFIERTFDDPSITNIGECLYDICLSAPNDCNLQNIYTIKGGKFAVYHFKGFIDEIHRAFQSIFNVWLVESNYSIDYRYGFEIYRKIDRDCLYMEIDLCIPIK